MESNSPLEALPAEVSLQILAWLVPADLTAVTRASPVLRARYLHDCEYIDASCFANRLGPATTLDALAAHYSRETDLRNRSNDAIAFAVLYSEAYKGTPAGAAAFPATRDALCAVVSFHTTIVQPLVDRYANWAYGQLGRMQHVLGWLTEGFNEDQRFRLASALHHAELLGYTEPIGEGLVGLSATEESRIVRAFYRFDVWCNLGANRTPGGCDEVSRQLADFFFGTFNAWEIEEVRCVLYFANIRYFRGVKSLWARHDAYHPNDPMPEWMAQWARNRLLAKPEQTAALSARGLRKLHSTICDGNSYVELAVDLPNMVPPFPPRSTKIPFFREMGDWLHRDGRDNIQLLLRPRRQFVSDPPASWDCLGGNDYHKLSLCHRWNFVVFGHVFWAVERTTDTKVQLLMRLMGRNNSSYGVVVPT